jgi:LemA protein
MQTNSMTKNLPFWLIPLAIIIVLACSISGWGITTYNTLVGSENSVDLAWNQVEVQYQRRFDLIPNLVSTVKGYAQQEQEIFTKIAEARSNYAGAKTTDEKAVAAGQVESALGRLLVITENYPDLKSNQNFLDLSTELKGN